LCFLSGVTIYINYRPILLMVRRIGNLFGSGITAEEGVSELKSVETALMRIRREYNKMSDVISEQRMMIVEYMLGNILYGLPVRKDKADFLDYLFKDKSFMVLSLQELQLSNKSREQLTLSIRQKLGITAYITDIQYDLTTVIICVIDDTNESEHIANSVKDIICDTCHKDFIIGAGETVNNLNDIRKSYLNSISCLNIPVNNSEKSKRYVNKHLKKLMLEYVNKHFHQPDINLMQVADHVNISVYTCSRLFKEFTGIGFKEYISAKRMELSKELLLSTNKNIYEIAVEAGFEHTSYFVTWFKANCGMSPNKFRNSSSV